MKVHPSFISQAGYHAGCALRHIGRAVIALANVPTVAGIVTAAILLALIISLTGCLNRPGNIRFKKGGGLEGPQIEEVRGVKDAGSPATVATDTQSAGIKVPKGSAITVTKTEAVAATEAAPFKPASEVVAFVPAADTEWIQRAQTIAASTGTIDTSVAKHRIDAAQRIWLLWGGIASLIGGMVVKSLVPAWPSLSSGLLLSGVALIGAWKFAEIPAWISLVIVGVVLALIAGYKRAEWDKDGNGIPDFIQKKTP